MKSASTTTYRLTTLANLGLGAMACLMLGGCISTTPVWDAHFGNAEKNVMQQQIIDPNPPASGPASTDGRAAVAAMDNYDKSLRNPTPQGNPFVIGIGSGASLQSTGGGTTGPQ